MYRFAIVFRNIVAFRSSVWYVCQKGIIAITPYAERLKDFSPRSACHLQQPLSTMQYRTIDTMCDCEEIPIMQEMPETIVPVMDRVTYSLDRIPEGPARDRLVDIREAFYEALEFPNAWIPAKLRDRKNKRRSIRFLQRAVEKKVRKVSQRDADKMAKANRIGEYRSDVDSGRDILFREDEMRVYNAHLRFCRIVGLVTQEDIDG
jgi:hypothetical protein